MSELVCWFSESKKKQIPLRPRKTSVNGSAPSTKRAIRGSEANIARVDKHEAGVFVFSFKRDEKKRWKRAKVRNRLISMVIYSN